MSLLSLPTFVEPGLSAAQETHVPKFPHTRAQLSAFARQYKPVDSYDSDADGDDFSRAPSSLVYKVIDLLEHEREEELKSVLKETYGMDDEALENSVLDLMHKHRDDIAGVPFMFLTPTRRPISRPSSRASSHSSRLHPARPETPNSAPSSPLALIFKRPHTPVTSPLAGAGVNHQPGSSYMTAKSDYSSSPNSSPVLSFAPTTQFTTSLPASPLSSPRLLHAKAHIQRPLSAASSNPGPRTDTPSPDMWSHGPFRASSNLAIAAPLLPDQSRGSSPGSNFDQEPLEEEDLFDPFTHPDAPPAFHSIVSDFDAQWSHSPMSEQQMGPENQPSQYLNPYAPAYEPQAYNPMNHHQEEQLESDSDAAAVLTDGMTPFDVLSSVFGSTLAPSELEEALANNGYDFERAMTWLIDRALPNPQMRVQSMANTNGGPARGRGGFNAGRTPPRYVNGRPVPGGNRVCRYFVAGECLRADCRFSHDLERALCRFWLRGACAKNENCEFLHHLPKDVDISSLNFALNRMNMASPPQPQMGPHLPSDDFPALGLEANGKGKRFYQDPGRTRFAAAVKKPPSQQSYMSDSSLAARREAMGSSADNLYHRSAIVAPRPSPRLKLRAPALLPTLPTGESLNQLYMTYRARALQLGAARNACLSRAADAWRRGDGAAAKRFSREGQELNSKMKAEMTSAAGKLVRERADLAEQAIRARDANWSDDPADRTTRGKNCGAGLGILLGVARKDAGDPNSTADERSEALLDLHGLHSNEATEILEEFLLALEQESFYGLAFIVVGEEKHVGTQDVARGASRNRLATGVREWVHRWGYPWQERDGIICIDPLTHLSE